MSFLFLCCCRPFLKGADDGRREYYDLLDVLRTCTEDDIKRAYKKKSLQLHPDKIAQRGQQLTVEDTAKFARIKEAYEALSIAKRRRLYDEYGETGLKMIEEPGSVSKDVYLNNFLHSSTSDRCCIFATLIGITAFILIWPILVCLRADRTIMSSWTAIWTPVWLVDALLLFSYWRGAIAGKGEAPEGLEDEWDHQRPERIRDALQFCCNVLFQIFLTLKLDKDVSWRWSQIFSPWLVWESILFGKHLGSYCKSPASSETDEVLPVVRRRAAWMGMQNGAMRIIFVILVALKLDDHITASWWAIFAPLWIFFGLNFFGTCVEMCVSQRVLNNLEPQHQEDVEGQQNPEHDPIREEAKMISQRASANCGSSCLLLLIALLAVARIAGAHFTVFIIFIPLFLLVGCSSCVFGCAVCCIRDPESMNAEHTPLRPGQGGVPQPTSPTNSTTPISPQPATALAAAKVSDDQPYVPPTTTNMAPGSLKSSGIADPTDEID